MASVSPRLIGVVLLVGAAAIVLRHQIIRFVTNRAEWAAIIIGGFGIGWEYGPHLQATLTQTLNTIIDVIPLV